MASFRLQVISGSAKGSEFRLEPGRTTFGTSSNATYRMKDDMASALHTALSLEGEKLTIIDLGSVNGTFVNGTKIEEETPVKTGDRILIGTVILKVMM